MCDVDVGDVWCSIAQALHARDRHGEAAEAWRTAIAAVRFAGSTVEAWALAGVVEPAEVAEEIVGTGWTLIERRTSWAVL